MVAIIEKDILKIEGAKLYNSGSIDYYESDVIFSDEWEGLTKVAIISQGNEGEKIPVVANKIKIDRKKSGVYYIGFLGYTLNYKLTTDTAIVAGKTYYTEEDGIYTVVANPVVEDISTYYEATKNYQISTNLVGVYFGIGAGEINAIEAHDLPDVTTWQAYVQQIQTIIDGAENVDIDAEKVGDTARISVTDRNNVIKVVEIKDGKSVKNIEIVDGKLIVTIE